MPQRFLCFWLGRDTAELRGEEIPMTGGCHNIEGDILSCIFRHSPNTNVTIVSAEVPRTPDQLDLDIPKGGRGDQGSVSDWAGASTAMILQRFQIS